MGAILLHTSGSALVHLHSAEQAAKITAVLLQSPGFNRETTAPQAHVFPSQIIKTNEDNSGAGRGGRTPTRGEPRRILSPLRLPVPPSRLEIGAAFNPPMALGSSDS